MKAFVDFLILLSLFWNLLLTFLNSMLCTISRRSASNLSSLLFCDGHFIDLKPKLSLFIASSFYFAHCSWRKTLSILSFDDTSYFLYQAFQITVSWRYWYVLSWIIKWDLIYLWVAWSDYSAQLYIYIYIYIHTQSSDRFIRQIHLFDDHIGVKLRVTKVMSYWLVQPLYIYTHTYIYCGRKKTNKLQVHPDKSVLWLPTHQGISL